MKTVEKKVFSSSLYKVSAYATLAMILFFLLMKLVGLVTVVELRFMNFFIMFLGVRTVLLNLRETYNGKLEYLSGMLNGFLTAFFTSIFFAVFVFIYLSIDDRFMLYLKDTQPFGSYLSPASAALITMVEGVAAGAILAFAMMHLFNRDDDRG